MYKIFLTDFPFLDKPKSKRRPVLQLTAPQGKYKTIIVAYITSKNVANTENNIVLEKLGKTGLTQKSVIVLSKLLSIAVSDLKKELGELSVEKSAEVRDKLKRLFQL